MVFRPQPNEQNREPTWELVEMLNDLISLEGKLKISLEESPDIASQVTLLRRGLEDITVLVSEVASKYLEGEGESVKVDTLYKISDLDIAATPMYFGFIKETGEWYIMKLTDAAARYIKGDMGYTSSWTDRATLVYDYANNVF